MLTELQLRDLLNDFESETVERTRAFDKADKMGQAISAFANDLANRQKPGYLLLGVEDDGKISGRRIDDEHYASLGGLKTDGNLRPPPSMSIEKFSLEEGDVVVIEVFPSKYPPIYYKGQAWVRLGARKSPATDEDIHILEERRNQYGLRFEEMPCESAELHDLDLDLFSTGYLPKAIASEVIADDSRPIEDQLASLRFWNRKTSSPTNLGLILFGKHPELFIPSAYIQYVRFSGQDNGSDILAEHAYKGPLLRTIMDLNGFIKAGLATGRPIKISPLQEMNFYVYPEWAIRELLLNAIIHRDYQIGNAPIKFYEYEGQRLEISNPGGLYGQANKLNFPFVSDYRNPLLAEAMKVMGLVNKFNRGIAKVRTELDKNGNPPPYFDVNHSTVFRVTLLPAVPPSDSKTVKRKSELITTPDGRVYYLNGHFDLLSGEYNPFFGNPKFVINPITGKFNPIPKEKDGEINSSDGKINGEITTSSGKIKPTSGEINGEINGEIKTSNLGENDEAVYQAIVANPGIKREKLLKKTDISLRTIDRSLQRLKASGRIEYRGSKKTGGWFVKT